VFNLLNANAAKITRMPGDFISSISRTIILTLCVLAVLHHAANIVQYCAKPKRVLKPGGSSGDSRARVAASED